MKQGTSGEATLRVNVPPETLYRLVSDVTRMGEWSPETVRCRWLDGATAPAVGARFKGTNRRAFMRWSTNPHVIVAEPGREFTFDVDNRLTHRKLMRWRYQFEPALGGTDLTESFELVGDLPWYISFVQRSLMGIKDRRADLEAGMQRTLERIKAVAERTA